jgi:hypothetical protein
MDNITEEKEWQDGVFNEDTANQALVKRLNRTVFSLSYRREAQSSIQV